MTYGIDLPIIIWANGKYINLLNEAINIYNQNSSYILNVIINNLSDEEIKDRLDTYTNLDDFPNLILVDDVNIKKYINTYANLFEDISLSDLVGINVGNGAINKTYLGVLNQGSKLMAYSQGKWSQSVIYSTLNSIFSSLASGWY